MPPAPQPADEVLRLQALMECRVLDSAPEPAFDDLTKLAARLCSAPIALISLVDRHRQWFKSRRGLDATETPRDMAFCGYAIQAAEPLVIRDAASDPRTSDNPLVTGDPGIRFYAGIPLRTTDGLALGTLCVIDLEPRDLSPAQLADLIALGGQASTQLELRRHLGKLDKAQRELHATNTALMRSNQDLNRRNAELDEFSYIASHDLQEPLRKLISFSKLLECDLGPDLPPAAKQDLDFISDAARRMSQLIEDLLTLSRTGRSTRSQQAVHLDSCLDDALDALQVRIQERGAAIERQPLPFISGDATLLTQLFQNLIGNALKFAAADRNPVVSISAKHTSDTWQIEVADNGIGIKAEYAEQIFAPFKRLHGRHQYAGSGIGLAICRKAVEWHGGHIQVESQPGIGSTFIVTLPQMDNNADEQPQAVRAVSIPS